MMSIENNVAEKEKKKRKEKLETKIVYVVSMTA